MTSVTMMDIAKKTIKENIDTKEYNTNVKSYNNNTSSYYTQDAKDTIKQSTLNENYISHMNNSSNGLIQESYDIPMTMKDIYKVQNHNNAAHTYNNPRSQRDIRNMNQNISKEIISQGIEPTLSGVKQIPTQYDIGVVDLKNIPNSDYINIGSLTNNNMIDFSANIKNKPSYDERLYKELLESIEENDYVNNIVFQNNI